MTPNHRLTFRSTDKPGRLRDGCAECLGYHCEGPRRPATWPREAIVRASGTRGSDRTHRANEIEQGVKLDFDGLDGGWRLCFGLLPERDFNDHECSKLNEVFLVAIDGLIDSMRITLFYSHNGIMHA